MQSKEKVPEPPLLQTNLRKVTDILSTFSNFLSSFALKASHWLVYASLPIPIHFLKLFIQSELIPALAELSDSIIQTRAFHPETDWLLLPHWERQ